MKNLTLAIVCLIAVNASADPETITFTNKAGEVVSSAPILSVSPIYVSYETPSGGARVKLADLPMALQKAFHYNPTNALAETRAIAERRAAARALADAAGERLAAQYAYDQQRAAIAKNKTYIAGHVIQRLSGSLFLVASEKDWQSVRGNGIINDQTVSNTYNGTCLLEAPGSNWVDGDLIISAAYPNGTYVYTSVLGADKTVRRFHTVLEATIFRPLSDIAHSFPP
jgi:hypothetical protein